MALKQLPEPLRGIAMWHVIFHTIYKPKKSAKRLTEGVFLTNFNSVGIKSICFVYGNVYVLYMVMYMVCIC